MSDGAAVVSIVGIFAAFLCFRALAACEVRVVIPVVREQTDE